MLFDINLFKSAKNAKFFEHQRNAIFSTLEKLKYPLRTQSQFFTKLQNFAFQIIKRICHS